jgi:hypothetical protein
MFYDNIKGVKYVFLYNNTCDLLHGIEPFNTTSEEEEQ